MKDSYSIDCGHPINTILSTPTQFFSSNFNIENHYILSIQPQNTYLQQKVTL